MATNKTRIRHYRGFHIMPTDPVPPIPGWRDHAVTWVHADYDGPEDHRIGTCRDDDAARADIDEYIRELDCEGCDDEA